VRERTGPSTWGVNVVQLVGDSRGAGRDTHIRRLG